MRKLIKFVIVVIILTVFLFSDNTTVATVRQKTLKLGKELFVQGTDSLKSSENPTIVKIGETIQ